MALSFPLALANLADLLRLESVSWDEFRSEHVSTTGAGEFLTADLAPPLWQADCVSVPLYHADAEQMRARIRALDGSNRAFYLYNPKMRYPQADPDGAVLGASSVTVQAINANRRALALTGLPNGYVLTVGDMLAITFDTSRRALLQIVEGATADGSGVTPEFELRPHLRAGITTTLAVTLKNPAAKVKILPGTARIDQRDGAFSVVRFSARQTMAQ